MSVDLDWAGLAPSFAEGLQARLNALLSDVELPAFLGPVRATRLDLGAEAPDVQVVQICEPWREFREASRGAGASSKPASRSTPPPPPRIPMRLHTFRQYNDDTMPLSVGGGSASLYSELDEASTIRWSDTESEAGTMASSHTWDEPVAPETDIPSVQLHLSVVWPTSTLRLELQTTLYMEHNDTTVMSLPVTLAVTGFELLAQVIVALDGQQRCVHLSVSESSPNEPAADGLRAPHDARIRSRHQGQRILPYLAVESQVGEPTKHVLENVGKVERFVADTVRQLLQDELVYPHFYTVYFDEAS